MQVNCSLQMKVDELEFTDRKQENLKLNDRKKKKLQFTDRKKENWSLQIEIGRTEAYKQKVGEPGFFEKQET